MARKSGGIYQNTNNEVMQIATTIDDDTASDTTTYSSEKIEELLSGGGTPINELHIRITTAHNYLHSTYVSVDGEDIYYRDFWVTPDIKRELVRVMGEAVGTINYPDATIGNLISATMLLNDAISVYSLARRHGLYGYVADELMFNLANITAADVSSGHYNMGVVLSTWGGTTANALTADNHLIVSGRASGSAGAFFAFERASMNVGANMYRVEVFGHIVGPPSGTNFRIEGIIGGSGAQLNARLHNVALDGNNFEAIFTIGPTGSIAEVIQPSITGLRFATNASGAGANMVIETLRTYLTIRS